MVALPSSELRPPSRNPPDPGRRCQRGGEGSTSREYILSIPKKRGSKRFVTLFGLFPRSPPSSTSPSGKPEPASRSGPLLLLLCVVPRERRLNLSQNSLFHPRDGPRRGLEFPPQEVRPGLALLVRVCAHQDSAEWLTHPGAHPGGRRLTVVGIVLGFVPPCSRRSVPWRARAGARGAAWPWRAAPPSAGAPGRGG